MFAPEPGCGTKRPHLPEGKKSHLVAVVTAIPEEFEAIAKFVSDGRQVRAPGDRRGFLLKGRMGGAAVHLAMTGDGAMRAAASVSYLLSEFPVSLLVGAGAAGALDRSLRAGEIVVAKRLVDDSGEAPPPYGELVSCAVGLGARAATFVSAARPITSSNEKRETAVRFGIPDSTCAVVDMESSAWARASASRGVPFLILRAVSDTFEEDLPGFLSSCLSPEGSIDRAAVARRLVLHPGALPILLRMRARVRSGAEALAVFLEQLFAEKV